MALSAVVDIIFACLVYCCKICNISLNIVKVSLLLVSDVCHLFQSSNSKVSPLTLVEVWWQWKTYPLKRHLSQSVDCVFVEGFIWGIINFAKLTTEKLTNLCFVIVVFTAGSKRTLSTNRCQQILLTIDCFHQTNRTAFTDLISTSHNRAPRDCGSASNR